MRAQRQGLMVDAPTRLPRRPAARTAPAPACQQRPEQQQPAQGNQQQPLKAPPSNAAAAASTAGRLAGAGVNQPPAEDTAVAAASAAEGGLPAKGLWAELPAKYKLVLATSFSFVICNMDKVNISVAIIPMAHEFGWSSTVAGLVQSSFFWGYLLSQIPGGYAASLLGGRKVLPAGVGVWSAATAGVPMLASTLPGLFLSRALVGLGEGVAPSAATDLVARSIPTEQRSRAISFIFGGLHVGSLLGLIVAPAAIERFGWPSVFYLFGGLGLVWVLWWERLMREIAQQDPELMAALTAEGGVQDTPPPVGQQQQLGDSSLRLGGGGSNAVALAPGAAAAGEPEEAGAAGHGGHGGVIDSRMFVPWRAFIRNPPLRALAYAHFCNNWFHYTMLAWMPTYFTDSLSLDLAHAAQVSLLPPVAAIAASALAGPSADALIARGVPVVTVRKAAQCTAFLGPAACLFTAGQLEGGVASVGLVALSLGLASFSLAGLYCNHADLSPRYSSILLGLTNTTGALPGIVGVAITGFLFDQTGSWGLSLFAPSIFLFLTGSAAFVYWGSADRQDFSGNVNNQPFAFERWLRLGGGGGDGAEERLKPPGGAGTGEQRKKED